VVRAVPEDISIEITNVCNFRCVFCPQSDPRHHDIVPKSYLTPERAETLLRRLRDGGVRTACIHWTHDGEPFMYGGFHEICAAGVRHGFNRMYFATNGMLCTPARLDRLPVDDCRYTFTIDFSSDEEMFERLRGTPGSWQRVKDNVTEILRRESCRHIRVELREISSFSEPDPQINAARVRHLKSMFPRSDRLNVYSKAFHNACGVLTKWLPERPGRYHLCPYPWTSLSVASTGDVVACSRDLRRQTVLGNLLEQPLEQIWNGPAMQEMRENLLAQRPDANGACAGCDMPYGGEKFTAANIYRTLRGRLRLFDPR
jgi:radical SAM protein with 4Fe4S-binding SPASM domain